MGGGGGHRVAEDTWGQRGATGTTPIYQRRGDSGSRGATLTLGGDGGGGAWGSRCPRCPQCPQMSPQEREYRVVAPRALGPLLLVRVHKEPYGRLPQSSWFLEGLRVWPEGTWGQGGDPEDPRDEDPKAGDAGGKNPKNEDEDPKSGDKNPKDGDKDPKNGNENPKNGGDRHQSS